MDTEEHKKYLKRTIELARESMEKGGFPAGALVVKDGKIIAEGLSLGSVNHDPTGHAETVAIREACKNLHTTNLNGAVLYESLQRCVMCLCVANWAGISRIVTACRKTNEMVEKGYYEGAISTEELNLMFNRQIDLDFLPDFEEESLKIIKEWESKQKTNP